MINDDSAKRICLERDSKRCRHCGSNQNLLVVKLFNGDGPAFFHLSNLITLCKNCYEKSEKNLYNISRNRVGVLLAGGKGTRLYPQTKFQNKHTLSIGLVPMIFYPLKTLREFGVYRAIVIVDRENSSGIMEMMGSGKEFGMSISYRVQEGASGIASALNLAKDFIKKDDEIVCVLGDNIFDNEMIDKNIELSNGQKACVYVKKVNNPSDYGVAIIKDGRVEKIIEKPKEFVSDLAVVGLYAYTYDVFKVIGKINPSKRGELEISDVNDYYANKGQLIHKSVGGFWGDAGSSIQKYSECNMFGAKQANVSEKEFDNFKSVVFDEK